MSYLKKSLAASYEIASSKTKLAQQRQREGYDLRCRGAVVECGDRVLVKIVAFVGFGRHTISDKWENDPYIVLDQPNPEVPVFFKRSEYFMGTAGDCDVPISLDPDGGGTSIRVANARTTGRITGCTAER